jgi:triacylglycerol lipase
MADRRSHIVLLPGFAGFDMLGQLEYYAGVTQQFKDWQAGHGDAVLHYFDSFPTAAVATRAMRLRNYLAKRMLRGEFAKEDRITLVGHSTGGLDIRRLIWDLAKDCESGAERIRYSFDGVPKTSKWKIDPRQMLKMIDHVVFLSVPQWGTNLADAVKEHDLLRKMVVDGLCTAVVGSQVPLLDTLEDSVATCIAEHGEPDVVFAIRDSLSEATPVCGGKGMRGAAAQEAASQLWLWLRHMASDFDAINDLTPWRRSAGDDHERASPAHFGFKTRDKERAIWTRYRTQTKSFATISPRPEQSGTDFAYRICHSACASGAFHYPGPGDVPEPKEAVGTRKGPIQISDSDNDGIVNTASMFWPNGADTVLVEGDHMDIVGHYHPVPAPKDTGRKYQAYDLLMSESGFDDSRFAGVWNEIFEFALR